MTQDKYSFSFTAASLAMSESVTITETYLQLRDWDAVKTKVWADNLLQARTESSSRRVYREIWPRLRDLTHEQLELVVDGDHLEQQQILWFAICKRYAFIREFAVEVIHEKFLHLGYEMTELDYRAFFNRKADWHPEMDKLKESTQVKIKTRLFRILKQVGILSDDDLIIPTNLSMRVIDVLDPAALQIYPIAVAGIGEMNTP